MGRWGRGGTHGRAIIEVVDGGERRRARALGDVAQEAAHGLLGVVADVVHVLLYGREAVIVDDYSTKLSALTHILTAGLRTGVD